MTRPLLTLTETAKFLRISERGVQRLVEQCKLPRCILGRRVLFRPADVERLVNRSTR